MGERPADTTDAAEYTATLSFGDRVGSPSARVEEVSGNGRSTGRAGLDVGEPGGVLLERPKAPRRVPTARLPRADSRFGAGVLWTALLYAVLGVGAVLWGNRVLDEYAKGLGAPGIPGGGGGGGGARQVRYIELPPLPSSAAQTRRPEPKPEPTVPVQVPQPVVEPPEVNLKELTPEFPQIATLPADPPQINVETLGAGSGTGVGPGVGAGTGGGVGTGQGTGIGAGVGPGTGGDGGVVVAPAVRTVIYPFEEPPPQIRGTVFRVRFWVDARGRPTKVEIEPPIDDASFSRKLLDRMRQWTFYPARTLEGRPVNGQLVVTYEP